MGATCRISTMTRIGSVSICLGPDNGTPASVWTSPSSPGRTYGCFISRNGLYRMTGRAVGGIPKRIARKWATVRCAGAFAECARCVLSLICSSWSRCQLDQAVVANIGNVQMHQKIAVLYKWRVWADVADRGIANRINGRKWAGKTVIMRATNRCFSHQRHLNPRTPFWIGRRR